MEQKPKTVPYRVFEELEARNKYTVKRLTTIIIVLISLLFVSLCATCAVFVFYETQYEEVLITQESEGDAISNYVGNDGSITNNFGGE